MSEESVMGQGMGTWLKDECRDMGISLIGTADAIQHIGTIAITEKNSAMFGNIKAYIASDVFQPSPDEMRMVGRLLDDIEGDIKSDSRERALGKLLHLVIEYQTIALKHTIECQCGKQTGIPIGKTVVSFTDITNKVNELGGIYDARYNEAVFPFPGHQDGGNEPYPENAELFADWIKNHGAYNIQYNPFTVSDRYRAPGIAILFDLPGI